MKLELNSEKRKNVRSPLEAEMVLGAFPDETAESLKSEEDRASYLDACLKEGDPALVLHALGVIARAKGMAQLARETGLSRTSLHRILSTEGNPEFATVLKVIKALRIKLRAEAA